MIKVYSVKEEKLLEEEIKSEAELNTFLSTNWNKLFPNLIFIKSELSLKGNVRSNGNNGRIDILAFNPKTNRFVVIELKKNSDSNIKSQASDYKDYIEQNLARLYLTATQTYNIELPKFNDIKEDSVEMILIARSFSDTDKQSAKQSKESLRLIQYSWIKDYLILDCIGEVKQEIKVKELDKEASNLFYRKDEAFRLLNLLYSNLNKLISNVEIEVKSNTIKIKAGACIMSIVGYMGRKALLTITTSFAKFEELGNIVKEKVLKNKSNYEISISNEAQLYSFISLLSAKQSF